MFYMALQLVTIVIFALCAYIVYLLLSSLCVVLVGIVFFVILMTFLYLKPKWISLHTVCVYICVTMKQTKNLLNKNHQFGAQQIIMSSIEMFNVARCIPDAIIQWFLISVYSVHSWQAVIEILMYLGATGATAYMFWPISQTASKLLFPLLGWISLASSLTIGVWFKNKDKDA